MSKSLQATVPDHLRVSDPGKIEGNTVFIYLDAFCREAHFEEFLPEYASTDEQKAHHQRGGLGDVKVKKFLDRILQKELAPIRVRRKEFERGLPMVHEMLRQGSENAREVAAETLDRVRHAMRTDYFNDSDFLSMNYEKRR